MAGTRSPTERPLSPHLEIYRLTSIAGIPPTFFLAGSCLYLIGADYEAARSYISSVFVAPALVLVVIVFVLAHVHRHGENPRRLRALSRSQIRRPDFQHLFFGISRPDRRLRNSETELRRLTWRAKPTARVRQQNE
ncbi:MAG TPA: hypothetical protein ENH05_01515 [Rhizobiales bacterium]|nr:hypothetical protein [Hyphomicrobiales bacterium]